MRALLKKEIIISALFAVLLTLAFLNIKFLGDLTGSISRCAEAAADSMSRGERDEAEEYATEAFGIWQRSRVYTNIVLKHESYADGETALIQLLSEIYSDEKGGVLGASEAVRRSMKNIAYSESVSLDSIF